MITGLFIDGSDWYVSTDGNTTNLNFPFNFLREEFFNINSGIEVCGLTLHTRTEEELKEMYRAKQNQRAVNIGSNTVHGTVVRPMQDTQRAVGDAADPALYPWNRNRIGGRR